MWPKSSRGGGGGVKNIFAASLNDKNKLSTAWLVSGPTIEAMTFFSSFNKKLFFLSGPAFSPPPPLSDPARLPPSCVGAVTAAARMSKR